MNGHDMVYDAPSNTYTCSDCLLKVPYITVAMGRLTGLCPGTPNGTATTPTTPAVPAWAQTARQTDPGAKVGRGLSGHLWIKDPSGSGEAVCDGCRTLLWASSGTPLSVCPAQAHWVEEYTDQNTLATELRCRDCRVNLKPTSLLTGCTGPASVASAPNVQNLLRSLFGGYPPILTPTQKQMVDTFWKGSPLPAPTSSKPHCPDCDRELSATLDVYYGRDEYVAARCVDCRKGLKEWNHE